MHMEPGEVKQINVLHGDYEKPAPFHIILPSDWVNRYTIKGSRQIQIAWIGDKLEISPLTTSNAS